MEQYVQRALIAAPFVAVGASIAAWQRFKVPRRERSTFVWACAIAPIVLAVGIMAGPELAATLAMTPLIVILMILRQRQLFGPRQQEIDAKELAMTFERLRNPRD